MATIKPSRAFAKKRFESFAGLGGQRPLHGEGASNMCNFRVMQDGSLCSREGYRTLSTLDGGSIRGFWEGSLACKNHCFAAAGTSVYLLDPDNGTPTLVSSLASNDGNVEFFQFEEQLYLLDGEELRVYQPSSKSFIPVEPYVPLIGNQWHPTNFGEIYEPLNLLTSRMRVRYLNSIASTTFYLPFYAQSVEAVYVDGTKTSDVTVQNGGEYIEVPAAKSATRIDVVMTANFLNDSSLPLQQARHALVHTLESSEQLLLYGTNEDCCVYCSTPVTSEMLTICRALIPSALPLYFKESDVLFLGSTEHPAHALLPYSGGILAFGDSQVWRLYSEDQVSLDAEALNSGIGCPSHSTAILCDGTPTLAETAGLTQMEAPLSRPELLSAVRIAYPALQTPFRLSPSSIAAWLPAKREIWLRDPDDATGSVWIYQTDKKEWYRFDGIAATIFFHSSNGFGFGTADGKLCLFDSTATTDDGTPFHCFYQSTCFDFGTPETVRRSLRLSVCANLHGGEAALTLMDENRTTEHCLRGKAEHALEHFEIRRRNGRYRFLCFSLDAQSSCKIELYKLSFFTNT